VSDAHPASIIVASKLEAFSKKLSVLHMARGRAANKETCPCMLVIMDEFLVSDRAYQEDVRDAIDAELRIVLVQDCTKMLSDTSDVLWNRLAADQGHGLFPFKEKHIRAIFNPISIRCKPELLTSKLLQPSLEEEVVASVAAGVETDRQCLFNDSTLVQIERSIADAQPPRMKLSAKLSAIKNLFGGERWRACCAKRGTHAAAAKLSARSARRQRGSGVPVPNPIYTAQSSSSDASGKGAVASVPPAARTTPALQFYHVQNGRGARSVHHI
jgi:hypothetical protein